MLTESHNTWRDAWSKRLTFGWVFRQSLTTCRWSGLLQCKRSSSEHFRPARCPWRCLQPRYEGTRPGSTKLWFTRVRARRPRGSPTMYANVDGRGWCAFPDAGVRRLDYKWWSVSDETSDSVGRTKMDDSRLPAMHLLLSPAQVCVCLCMCVCVCVCVCMSVYCVHKYNRTGTHVHVEMRARRRTHTLGHLHARKNRYCCGE
jgi:hypothetical protein